MDNDEIFFPDNEMSIDEGTSREELIGLISTLHEIIKKQNQVILKFKNSYIRLENNMKLIESKIEYYSTYKRLCEIILDKTNQNPISALWFLRSVRKKIEEFNKQY